MELHESSLGKGPKGFNAINMAFVVTKLIVSMVYSIMFLISQVHQAIIASPLIRVNNAVRSYFTANNGLQRSFNAIWYDFGIYFTTTLQDAEYRSLATCPTTPFPLNASATKVCFININFSLKRLLSFTKLGNPCTDQT